MTTKSILETAGDSVDIIAVDDASDIPFEFNEPAPNLKIMRMRHFDRRWSHEIPAGMG